MHLLVSETTCFRLEPRRCPSVESACERALENLLCKDVLVLHLLVYEIVSFRVKCVEGFVLVHLGAALDRRST